MTTVADSLAGRCGLAHHPHDAQGEAHRPARSRVPAFQLVIRHHPHARHRHLRQPVPGSRQARQGHQPHGPALAPARLHRRPTRGRLAVRDGAAGPGGRECLPGLAARGAAVFNNVSGRVANARAIAQLVDAQGCELASLVHPAVDLDFVELGRAALLPEGCVVGSRTRIGEHLAARLHAVISHDVVIEDFVFIGPGSVLGSHVHVEEGAFLGAGVTVMTGCRIGRHSVIGAGALVTRDVPPGVTVGGARGQVIRQQGRE